PSHAAPGICTPSLRDALPIWADVEGGDRLRIALVTETFLPKVDGVVTRLVATLEALERLGHEVLVLAPPGAPDTSAGARVVAASGLPFPRYPEHTIALPFNRHSRDVEDFAPHVAHVVNTVPFGTWCAFIARRQLGTASYRD